MMELFIPIIEESNFHKNFIGVISEKEDYCRKVLLEWASGFIDRDGKFVKELQISFNSAFWELYLFACLKELGFKVDFSFDRPDFVIKNNEILLSIEASIASSAVDSINEWEANYDYENIIKIDKDKIVDFATIRLANTLTTKYKKFEDSYSNLSHVIGKPFIIAIAPFEQPFFYLQNEQAMRRVLYGFDKFIYKDFPEKNERIILGQEYMTHIKKPNGAEISLAYFINQEMNDISAVIFSNTATFGKVRALSQDPGDIFFEVIRYNDNGLRPIHKIIPKNQYKETLLDGLHIFYNPFAKNPIPYRYFDRLEITHHDFDIENGRPLVKTNDGALFQRSTQKYYIHSEEKRNKIYAAMEKVNLKLQEKDIKSDCPLTIKDVLGFSYS